MRSGRSRHESPTASSGGPAMLTKRIIPCLDVDGGRVVKGTSFVNLRDAGDPVELSALYDAEGADELVFLDITASSDERDTMVDVVQRTAERVFIPLTVGGGIRSVEDMRRMLRRGAELGAGEILLTSMDADGQLEGYDVALTATVAAEVPVPVIASGGAGTLEHLHDAIARGQADAVLAATIFHYGAYRIRDAKAYLASRGVPVRPTEGVEL